MTFRISKREYPRHTKDHDKPTVFCESCDVECSPDVPTKEECLKYGCGRPYPCCTIAGNCPTCGERWIAVRDAPEFNPW